MIPARRSEVALRFFDRYVARYLARRFDRLWLWGRPDDQPVPAEGPLLFVLSHGSWWDVLVSYHLSRRVVRVESYGPMDEAQLARYRVLTRIGVYSVDRGSTAGLRAFLRYTAGLLTGRRAVWITPQGEILPSWVRPVRFQPGVGHLVRQAPGVAVLPVAVVYEFLDEPRPEIFVKIGPARRFEEERERPDAITRLLEHDLERELDLVLGAIRRRELGVFSALLGGATSVSLVYDSVRAVRARLTGRPDPARHGDVVSDPRKRGA